MGEPTQFYADSCKTTFGTTLGSRERDANRLRFRAKETLFYETKHGIWSAFTERRPD